LTGNQLSHIVFLGLGQSMKLATQRNIDRIAGKIICRILSLLPRFQKEKQQNKIPQKILIIMLSEMGSLVLSGPMFQLLAKKYPGAAVYVLMFEQNREILELMEVVPVSNILTVRNASFRNFMRDSCKVIKNLRRIKVEAAIDCELFSRVSSIFSFLSGANKRVGFHPHTQEGLYRGNFINRPVLYNTYTHISEQLITLVDALDDKNKPAGKRIIPADLKKISPLPLTKTEKVNVRSRLENDFPGITEQKLILLNPGGGLLPIRAWPLEYFCRLAQDLIRSGYAVGVIGMNRDRDSAKQILEYCENKCFDFTGYTKTIKELILIFDIAALLISNDGGPGHFATLIGLPSIILFGPETPVLYGPLDNRSYVFYKRLSCSPCLTAYNHRNSPCDGNNICLKEILPAEVAARAFNILEET